MCQSDILDIENIDPNIRRPYLTCTKGVPIDILKAELFVSTPEICPTQFQNFFDTPNLPMKCSKLKFNNVTNSMNKV